MNAVRNGAQIATEVVLPGRVEPSGLQVRERTLAPPAAGQALVRVEATGVSFAEQQMRRGRYPSQPKFPFVPGYDLVGTVESVGADVDARLVGTRVAALTKVGGWSSRAVVAAATLVPVPAGVEAADAETVVVNGVTAYQMLHRSARVRRGQTILVHGANGGVGGTLVQLARHEGVRVIGTAAPRHHQALRALGVTPIDYHAADLVAQVRATSPDGVDAVFDHLGPDSIRRSFDLLGRGGTLVAYGTATKLDDTNSVLRMFLGMLGRITVWNALPNGRHATFYNVWSGSKMRPARFRAQLRTDLGAVFDLLSRGVLTAQVAARFPLTDAAAAMELAESGTVRGKVILLP